MNELLKTLEEVRSSTSTTKNIYLSPEGGLVAALQQARFCEDLAKAFVLLSKRIHAPGDRARIAPRRRRRNKKGVRK